ncbi:hypothetical protein PR048_030111 [Dryococelus australis]|uniref:DUF4371 domain-containing protein n=1 Tax=Dryococelus australis TaxID=614101 RepID=A0ABQ9GAW2_9NEOP|nr:hypothetical protein PR048_030111 [Dryococelus australis]
MTGECVKRFIKDSWCGCTTPDVEGILREGTERLGRPIKGREATKWHCLPNLSTGLSGEVLRCLGRTAKFLFYGWCRSYIQSQPEDRQVFVAAIWLKCRNRAKSVAAKTSADRTDDGGRSETMVDERERGLNEMLLSQYCPSTKTCRCETYSRDTIILRGHGGSAVSLLASYQGEPGSIPGRVTPGFSLVEIVPDDALVGGFPRRSPVSRALSFWRYSILNSFTLTGSQDLAGYELSRTPTDVRNVIAHRYVPPASDCIDSPSESDETLPTNCSINRQQATASERRDFGGNRIRTSPDCTNCELIEKWGHGGVVVRILASQLGEPGSIPAGVASPPPPGILACGNRAGQCRWSGGFLRDLPLPTIFHYGAAPYSARFTLIGSQDLDVKSRPNISNQLTENPRGVQLQLALSITRGTPQPSKNALLPTLTIAPTHPPLRQRDKGEGCRRATALARASPAGVCVSVAVMNASAARFKTEILGLLSNEICTEICSQQNPPIFSVIGDGTGDISEEQQLSVCFTWVDKGLRPHKSFVGLYSVGKTTGERITSVLLDAMIRLQLPISNFRGQAYDGAPNMSGKSNGVQAVLPNHQPLAHYDGAPNMSGKSNGVQAVLPNHQPLAHYDGAPNMSGKSNGVQAVLPNHQPLAHYDGAPNMSGKSNGVQAVLPNHQPLAHYVHCGAHCEI